jgi:hypothetical protein
MFAVEDHKLAMSSVRSSSASSAPVDANISGPENVSFLDSLHGWAVMGADGPNQLLSTSDAGASWTIITPPSIKGNVVGHPPRVRTPPLIWKRPSSQLIRHSTQSGPSADVSVHLGFDKQHVMDAPTMQAWWDTSQYWDTGVYLPGADNFTPDPILSNPLSGPQWITAIQTQGWGIWPIWVGAQPSTSCSGGAGIPGNCKKYNTTKIDPATANATGIAEANAAMQSAQGLSSAGGTICCIIIYKDIENYVVGTDGPAVVAYLNGWTTTLKAAGYKAGVYGNSGNAGTTNPAVTNFTQVTPAIDDVWITWSNKQVSTWNLFPPLGGTNDTGLWPTHQRMHQYRIDHSEAHPAGSLAVSIDSDIEDSTILANNGVKPYSWLWTLVISPYVDPQGGSALSFNDINDEDQLVGEYWTGSLNSGADYTGGTVTTINEPGITNPNTHIFAVNNIGDMSGQTYGSGKGGYWIRSATGKITPFNPTLPTGYNNLPVGSNFVGGLNDAGQMSGTLGVNAGGAVGYRYQAGTYGLLSYPAGGNTYGSGLNGQGQVVGTYQGQDGSPHGFFYSDTDGYSTIDYPGARFTSLLSINSNGEILGVTNSYVYFLYYNGAFTILPLPVFNVAGPYASGLNDFADISGSGTYTPGNGVNEAEGVIGQTQH